MEEEWEPYPTVALKDRKKSEHCVMKNVQKDIQSLGLIAIKIAQKDSETMAYFVDTANMEEE